MLSILLLLFQTVATPSIQDQIDVLTQERKQLVQLQADCGAANRTANTSALQAVIDKLTALKADPVADAEIDAILDTLIAARQNAQKDFDGITPGRPCTVVSGAAARIATIDSQLGKLNALKNK